MLLVVFIFAGFALVSVQDAVVHHSSISSGLRAKADLDFRVAEMSKSLGRNPRLLTWDIRDPWWGLYWGDTYFDFRLTPNDSGFPS
jgi:hypothetical protein